MNYQKYFRVGDGITRHYIIKFEGVSSITLCGLKLDGAITHMRSNSCCSKCRNIEATGTSV